MYAIRLKCTGTRTGSSSPCDPENNLASEKKKMKYNSNFTSAKVWVIFQNGLLETLPLYNLEYEGYEGKWFEGWGECSGFFFIWHVVTSNTLQTSSTYFWLTKKKSVILKTKAVLLVLRDRWNDVVVGDSRLCTGFDDCGNADLSVSLSLGSCIFQRVSPLCRLLHARRNI